MTSTAMLDRPETAATFRRIDILDPVYLRILGFLWDEAATLDRDDTQGWLAFLAPDISYIMPVCLTRRRNSGQPYESEALHFDEDHASLKARITRFNETQAWAVDPAPRARRFVTGVQVFETDTQGEFEVKSSLLVVRSQDDEFRTDLLTAERQDLIRMASHQDIRLARRRIVADQTTIGMHNLAIFL